MSTATPSTSKSEKSLQGLKFWLVTHGVGAQEGWEVPLEGALHGAGVHVESFGILSALARSSVDVLGANASKVVKTLRSLKSGADEDAESLVAQRRPDVILVDAPHQLQALHRVRNLVSPRPLMIGLVANFESSAEWMGQPVDALIAPTEEQLYDLRLVGSPEVAWQVGGPPVPSPWDQRFDRAEVRAALKVDDETIVVLVDVQNMAEVLIDRVVHQMGLLTGKVSVLYWYGGSDEAASTLRASSSARKVPARMFGGAASPARAAAGVDVVVVGDGALNLPGYVAAGLPILSVTQGALTHVLAQRGAMVPLPGPEGLGAVLRQIAAHGVAQSHKDAVEKVRTTMSAQGVVEALARILSGRSELEAYTAKANPTVVTLGLPIEEIGQTPAAPAFESRPASAPRPATLTRAAAREELARLIIEERRIERELKGVVDERDRWMQRAADARDDGDVELIAWADEKVQAYLAQVSALQQSLSEAQASKEALRERVASPPATGTYKDAAENLGSGGPADMERRFRELESKRMLRELRAKNKKND